MLKNNFIKVILGLAILALCFSLITFCGENNDNDNTTTTNDNDTSNKNASYTNKENDITKNETTTNDKKKGWVGTYISNSKGKLKKEISDTNEIKLHLFENDTFLLSNQGREYKGRLKKNKNGFKLLSDNEEINDANLTIDDGNNISLKDTKGREIKFKKIK